MNDYAPKHVLVTGSTGAIGRPVCTHLQKAGHHVRGYARRPTPGLEDYIQGDISDPQTLRRAMEGMDVVIHLAAHPDDADFLSVLLTPNIVAVYHICEAARECGMKRLILSSSVQAISGHSGRQMVRLSDGPAPTNHYALTKVYSEQIGYMYARKHGLSVITVRIGWLPRDQKDVERVADRGGRVFFSQADACRFYQRCVESQRPGAGESEVLFAASNCDNPFMDPGPARDIIGYVPQDRFPEGIPFRFVLDGKVYNPDAE